ncbi:MAG: NYN domain-containing protein [Spirochaetota bacterium]
MAILIDGFNLIYKFPELERLMYAGNLSGARIGLLNKLKEYRNITKLNITVIFDGKKDQSLEIKKECIKSIDVYYSLDYSADFLIKQFVKKDLNPRMITVVTSDKDIIDYVIRFKAKVKTSDDFFKHINATIAAYCDSPEPEKNENPVLDEEEILFWENQFKKN